MEDSRAVVERWYSALAAGDFDAVLGLFAEDIDAHLIGSTPFSGHHRGREPLAGVVGQLFELLGTGVEWATRWRIMAVDGERCVALMRNGGTAAGGLTFDQTYCHIFTVRDGQIAELWELFDTVLEEAAVGNRLEQPREAIADGFDF